MFGWLFKPWRRRSALKKREIFKYHDGIQIRYGDPYAIWRTITQDPEINLERISPLVDAGREPETSQYINLVRRAFGARPFDPATGMGLTDWQVLALICHLHEYTTVVKKNTSSGPSLPIATESPSSTGQAAPEEATNPSGDCTSTPAA